ncbi:FadR/GntR family transcriptional regulator [Acrocarpospora macrocephala]|uniref:GntR family transcriptional regulator n=1 Tax=Acrocarpospora macrocephala TaxID=150177 RepID=A0A5M3X4V7_9ACTN|nr:FadR/GntR family transcriptional regulator [Acrocarpospora macrocephala]GES15666.1 GntR family transcriptional regulator [Acrocarpospora macrocephala]
MTGVTMGESAPQGQWRHTRVPLGKQIADQIRDLIKTEGLIDGDPLPSESDLANRYGVSQRVVRDALRTLTNQGVVETRQGKRATVSGLRPVAVEDYFRLAVDAHEEAIDELLELRLAIETKAAGLAATRATAVEIAELRTVMAQLNDAEDDLTRRVELDMAFHSAIARASRNRFFQSILDALAEALTAERHRGGQLTEAAGLTHAETNTQHQALLLALEARDAQLAEQCMRAILERARHYFRDLDSTAPGA